MRFFLYFRRTHVNIEGVHYGDATKLENVKNGSQIVINIDNPYGYDPINDVILSKLASGGTLIITGSPPKAKNIFMPTPEKIIGKGLIIESTNTIINDGSYLQSNGTPVKSKELIQYIITKP